MESIRENIENSIVLRQKHRQGQLLHDIGLLLLLLCVFFSAISMAFVPENLLVPEIVMLAASCMGMLLAAFGLRYLAVAEAGCQVLLFTAYVLFRLRTQNMGIHWCCYLWVFLPILSVTSMLLFQTMNFQNDRVNQMLIQQMDELVLIDPLTGLYNNRALYLDLQRQMSFTSRNNIDLTLMCIRLRYASELKKILTAAQFDHLIQILAQNIEDTLRLEDRLYATDGDGSLAIILGCPASGGQVVKSRIKSVAANSSLFDQIVNQTLQVDLRIAFLQYDASSISNAMEFQQKVENELQYDV